MWIRTLSAGALAAIAIVTGCGDDGPSAGTCPGERVREVSSAIFGGASELRYLQARSELADAIALVRFVRPDGESRCTGFFVDPRWVLTARHCARSGATAEVSIGASAAAPARTLPVLHTFPHPTLDLELLELAEAVPDLEPVPLSSDDPARLVGSKAQIGGFGLTDAGELGSRRFAVVDISGVGSAEIQTLGVSRSGACEGDSGGPLLVRDRTGHVGAIGALSRGSAACNQTDTYLRLDAARGWITQLVGELRPAGPELCGGITAEGRCFAGTAVWCGGDAQVAAEHCEGDRACGYSSERGGVGCVTHDPCEGVDELGLCSGSALLRCTGGQLVQVDCGACDAMECRESSFDGASTCVTPE